jgi:hypothetical protein
MPDSNQPQVPNYVNGVGKLVTDRYDFEDHILGTNFRHNANSIDVIPGLVVSGSTYTNVLTALEALAAAAEPPVVAPATQTIPGTIQLTRDLGGVNGVSPIVIGLQGRPVSVQPPTVGNVLTWNGSTWIPQNVTGLFTPGGDLGGNNPSSNNTLQYVSSISGSSGTVSVAANNLQFGLHTTPAISQTAMVMGNGSSFNISAQNVSGNGTGGSLVLQGGSVGSGISGSTFINIAGSAVFQVGQVISGNNVAAFFTPGGGLTSTQMPSNSGSNVMYIGNASALPTTGTPVGGAILYASNGQLWVKQSDTSNFRIGSTPNPNSWASVSPGSLPISPNTPVNGKLTYNVSATSGVTTPVNVLTFPMPVNTSAYFDIYYVGKEIGNPNAAQYNYTMGFIRNGSSNVIQVDDGIAVEDSRTTGSFWNIPSINISDYISGSNVIITTGSSSATNAVWTIIINIIMTTA